MCLSIYCVQNYRLDLTLNLWCINIANIYEYGRKVVCGHVKEKTIFRWVLLCCWVCVVKKNQTQCSWKYIWIRSLMKKIVDSCYKIVSCRWADSFFAVSTINSRVPFQWVTQSSPRKPIPFIFFHCFFNQFLNLAIELIDIDDSQCDWRINLQISIETWYLYLLEI